MSGTMQGVFDAILSIWENPKRNEKFKAQTHDREVSET
jgi:hypothetical protein